MSRDILIPTEDVLSDDPAPHITALKLFGHSYVSGTGATKRDYAFGPRLAALLGAREENFGVSGSQWALKFNSAALLMQNVTPPNAAPYQVGSQVSVICTGLNDLNTQVLIDSNLKHFENTLRASIMRLRAKRRHEAETDSTWVFSGGANSLQTSQNSGTGYRRLTANGNTWTINVPSDFPGGELQIHGVHFDAWGAQSTVTVDGSAYTTWDTRTTTQYPDVALFHPTLLKITGLSAGAHTIVGTVANINSGNFETIDYWQVPSTDPGLVVVCNVARVPTYPGGGTHTATDADVANINTIIRNVCAEFDSRVIVYDMDSALGKNSALFYSDGTHPNDDGHAQIASDLYKLIRNSGIGSSTFSKAQLASADVLTTPRVLEGTNAAMGTATLVAGTVTVNDTRVTANTRIFLMGQNSSGTAGELTISARTAGTSFTITSASGTDTRTVAYLLVEPA